MQLMILLTTIIIDLVRDAKEIYGDLKDNKVAKDSILDAVKKALQGIDYFKHGAADYQQLILMTAESLIDSVISTYNTTGWWSKKITLDIPLNEEIEI